jgi:HupE / UreJ protein
MLPSLLLLGSGLFAANYLMLSGHLQDAARLRVVVTLVFGLIHGFGFATDLLELRLPTAQLLSILLGFNLGVEVDQLALVLIALGLAALLVRARLALPRPIVVDTLSAGLVELGMYWFLVDLRFMTIGFGHGVRLHLCAAHPKLPVTLFWFCAAAFQQ